MYGFMYLDELREILADFDAHPDKQKLVVSFPESMHLVIMRECNRHR
jgi:hypothetical protein